MHHMGKTLIIAGIILVIAGIFFIFGDKPVCFGRLPGDIVIQKKNFTFYFPAATCVLISIILSLVLFLFFRKK